MNISPKEWLQALGRLKNSMNKNKAKCSGCNSILSNMYQFKRQTKLETRELYLCDDCVGTCLSRLLCDEYAGLNNFETIWKYVNEKKEARRI